MKTSPRDIAKYVVTAGTMVAYSIGLGGCAVQGLKPGTEVFSVGNIYVNKNLEGKIGKDGERTFVRTYSVKKGSEGETKLRNNLPRRVLEKGGNTTISGRSKFPNLGDRQETPYNNTQLKSEELKGSHWYNNRFIQGVGASIVVAGLTYFVTKSNKDNDKNGNQSDIPQDDNVGGGTEGGAGGGNQGHVNGGTQQGSGGIGGSTNKWKLKY